MFESNGPDVKVRGTAQTVADKYLQLARDAISAGDIVMSESYFQHAEHYNRIIAANQSQNQNQNQNQNQPQQRPQNPASEDDQPEEQAPGTGPQPSAAEAGDGQQKGKSDAKGNGGTKTAEETGDDGASFDGELPQFLQQPTDESDQADKPKRGRKAPARGKSAKADDDEAEKSSKKSADEGGDEAGSDAEAAIG